MKSMPQQTLTISFQFLSHTLLSLSEDFQGKLKQQRMQTFSRWATWRPFAWGGRESAGTPGVPGPLEGWGSLPNFPPFKGSHCWLGNICVLLICTYWIWRHRWSVGTFCESKRNDFSNKLWPDLQSLFKEVSTYSRHLIETNAWNWPFVSIKSIAFLPDQTKWLILTPFVTS